MSGKRRRRRRPERDDYDDDYDDDYEDERPQKKSSTGMILAIVLAGVVAVFCMIALVAAIAIPNLLEAKRNANEAAAIGSIRAISAAQAIYIERSESQTYANSLSNLGKAGLIDQFLEGGSKQGYKFSVKLGKNPAYEYEATASPMSPETGSRYFKVDHRGVFMERVEGGSWERLGLRPRPR